MSPDDLDYTPLARRARLAARLGAILRQPRLTIAATVTVLLLVVPPLIVVALLAAGEDIDAGAFWMVAFLLVCGVFVAADLLHQAGTTDALTRFAQVNGLEALEASMPADYAGSLFAVGSHRVQQGVRTPAEQFVEVGDRYPTAMAVGSGNATPELYLRARVSGPVARSTSPSDVVPPLVHDRLENFAGSYALEVSGDELTVFGTRPLAVHTPGRVAEALALTAVLAGSAEGFVVTGPPRQTPSGIPVPTLDDPVPASTRRRSPWAVVGWTLVLLVGAPLAFAVVMSVLDDGLVGKEVLATVVVGLVVGLLLLVTRLVLTRLMTRPQTVIDDQAPRPSDGTSSPRCHRAR